MSASLFDLSGRTALVTGSTRGLGKAIALGLGLAGARVAINGRTASVVEERVSELAAAGVEAVAAPFEVTDEPAVGAAVGALGPVDVLVNNAGMTIRKRLEEWSLEEWEWIFAVNVTSAFLVARAVVPGMVERGRGKIVNICSVQSELARETIAPYTATKGALKNLTKAMCAEWARDGIQANGIGPGYFATELTEPLRADAEFDAWLRARVPAGRWGDPSELVGAAVFLASAASDFVNGQVLYVDGGLTAVI
ncbi:MAG TPA: SDR family oxidoreductase [Gaiellaceae bacterium]|nr:SDR family oxidoreductase [Gaiellaceae bacterium]